MFTRFSPKLEILDKNTFIKLGESAIFGEKPPIFKTFQRT
jgi:hypothetical protein